MQGFWSAPHYVCTLANMCCGASGGTAIAVHIAGITTLDRMSRAERLRTSPLMESITGRACKLYWYSSRWPGRCADFPTRLPNCMLAHVRVHVHVRNCAHVHEHSRTACDGADSKLAVHGFCKVDPKCHLGSFAWVKGIPHLQATQVH